MTESPDVRYGRLLEAAEISVYAAERAYETTKQLLESGEWEKVGQFKDISDFIRSIPFGKLNPPTELRQSYERLANDHGASQRAIGDSAGVGKSTVGRDLASGGPSGPPSPQRDELGEAHLASGGPSGPPSPQRDSVPPKSQPVPQAQRPMLTLYDHEGNQYKYPEPSAAPTFNETKGDGISWAAWSWNPVTGCLHGCHYCYARAIASRFKEHYPAGADGFTPLFHHERLGAPKNTRVPPAHARDEAYRRVFVCSMADLYGQWVPDEWIEQVHAAMLDGPEWWQYILLTKFPSRYKRVSIPAGAWVGTSVDEQKRVRIAEDAFREIDGEGIRKWLSLEPLLEPLHFDDLSMFDWVVIGAQTETHQPTGTVPAVDPDPDWVVRLTHQAREAGCEVHWKPNLRRSLWFDGYPS